MTKTDRYNSYFMDVAIRTAQNSYAKRSKVGAVLVKDNRIVATGWNGRVSGQPNTCEDWVEWMTPENVANYDELTKNGIESVDEISKLLLKTRADVVHAEANTIYFCAKHGIKTDGTILYITLSPCATCALAIIQAGIKEVYYHEKYRDDTGLKVLKDAGITTTKL